MNEVNDNTLSMMVTSTAKANDVTTLRHLLRLPSQPVTTTTTIAPLINHSHQYHYSIVKQRPSSTLTIKSCHSSSPPVTYSHHHHHQLSLQGGQVNDDNLFNHQQRRLSFSIDAILNSNSKHLLPSDKQQQQLNSLSKTINNGQSDKIVQIPAKSVASSTITSNTSTKKVPPLSTTVKGLVYDLPVDAATSNAQCTSKKLIANALNVLHHEHTDKVNACVNGGTSTLPRVSSVIKSANEVQVQPFANNVTFTNVLTHQEHKYNIKLSSPSSVTSPAVLQQLSPNTSDVPNDEQQLLVLNSSNNRRKNTSRGPRIPFTADQVNALEGKFNTSHYLSSREVLELAFQLDISEQRVKIWFQNRRARYKKSQSSKKITTTTTGHSQGHEEKMHQESSE